MPSRLFYRLALFSTFFALAVVLLGAYVRLSNAGLGCPDWPGCYGHLTVPQSEHELSVANSAFERPVETGKAWKEMAHRYFAGALGLLVGVLAVIAWRNRHLPAQPFKLAVFLVALVVFQALLGMWTVTLLLKPLVVVLHLLGGMATLALLWLMTLRSGGWFRDIPYVTAGWRKFALAALLVVIVQIFLGGWTSSNYAALACPDFPTCQTQWLPEMDLKTGFTLWHGLGIDYEGGILDNPARVAIHYTHRAGALATFLIVGLLALGLVVARRDVRSQALGAVTGALLLAQVLLGIAVVKFGLPLSLAVAHNGTAALLLLALVAVNFAFWRKPFD